MTTLYWREPALSGQTHVNTRRYEAGSSLMSELAIMLREDQTKKVFLLQLKNRTKRRK
jgi:hypothetical protein